MSLPADSPDPSSVRRGDNGWACSPAQRRFVLIAAILASALGFIDGSIVSIAMPSIRLDLGATLPQAQWVSNGYALTLSSLLLAGGAAGDALGLRKVFAAAISAFVLASVGCALAPDVSILISARVLQGIGAAVMVPCSLAIIARAYPRAERGRAIGIWAASSALTTALGPVLGGALLSALGPSAWRLIFAVNVPLGGLAAYLLVMKVPADKGRPRGRFDIMGAVLATASFGLLAYGLTDLEAEGSGLTRAIAIVGAGLALALVFIWWELRRPEPMVDLRLFANRSFAGANIATFLIYFALSAILFYLPSLLIAGWGMEAATSGFIFFPLSASISLLSGPVGKWADRSGPRLPIAAGSLAVALAFAGLALLSGAGRHHFWTGALPLMGLMGIGMGLIVSPLSTAIMTAVEDRDTGAASGINNSVSRVAGLLAVASMGAVASMHYRVVMAEAGGGKDIPGFGEPVPGGLSPVLEVARVAASDGAFSTVCWITAAFCALACLVAWTMIDGRDPETGLSR